jgi:hypothetical protein
MLLRIVSGTARWPGLQRCHRDACCALSLAHSDAEPQGEPPYFPVGRLSYPPLTAIGVSGGPVVRSTAMAPWAPTGPAGGTSSARQASSAAHGAQPE